LEQNISVAIAIARGHKTNSPSNRAG
jgi:hypothetical protein